MITNYAMYMPPSKNSTPCEHCTLRIVNSTILSIAIALPPCNASLHDIQTSQIQIKETTDF